MTDTFNPLVDFLNGVGPTASNAKLVTENNFEYAKSDAESEVSKELVSIHNKLLLTDPMTPYLDELDNLFFFGTSAKLLIVSGMAGDGKSLLITQLLRRHFSEADIARIIKSSKQEATRSWTQYAIDFSQYNYHQDPESDQYGCVATQDQNSKIKSNTTSTSTNATECNHLPLSVSNGFQLYLILDLSELIGNPEMQAEFKWDCFNILTQDPSIQDKNTPQKIILAGANYGVLLNLLEDARLEYTQDMDRINQDAAFKARLERFEVAICNLKEALLNHKTLLLNNLLETPKAATELATSSDISSSKESSSSQTEKMQDVVESQSKVNLNTAQNNKSAVIRFFDITNLYKASDLARLATNVLKHDAWENYCKTCSKQGQCPILHNRNLLCDEINYGYGAYYTNQAQTQDSLTFGKQLEQLFDLMISLGVHLSPRITLLLLSNMLLGFVEPNSIKRRKFNFKLLSCNFVHKTLEHPTKASQASDTNKTFSLDYTVRDNLIMENISNTIKSINDENEGEEHLEDNFKAKWYSNPFDNLFGLNMIAASAGQNITAANADSSIIQLFKQLNIIKIGHTSSPYFELALKQRLNELRSERAFSDNISSSSTVNLTDDEHSLLTRIDTLQTCLMMSDQKQAKYRESLLHCLIECYHTWFRFYFFKLMPFTWDSNDINPYIHESQNLRFQLTAYPHALEYLSLLNWSRSYKSNPQEKIIFNFNNILGIYNKLIDGLFVFFTRKLPDPSKSNGNNNYSNISLPFSIAISTVPCNICSNNVFTINIAVMQKDLSKNNILFLRDNATSPYLPELVFSTSPVLNNNINLNFSHSSTAPAPKEVVLPLHLHDFEYLRQLGEGLMPQTVSNECYHRFMQFKKDIQFLMMNSTVEYLPTPMMRFNSEFMSKFPFNGLTNNINL